MVRVLVTSRKVLQSLGGEGRARRLPAGLWPSYDEPGREGTLPPRARRPEQPAVPRLPRLPSAHCARGFGTKCSGLSAGDHRCLPLPTVPQTWVLASLFLPGLVLVADRRRPLPGPSLGRASVSVFVLNVGDGVPWGQRGFTKSQRSSNNHEPFIFSKETEKQGHFHTGPWRRWALKCTLPGLVRPAGGAEERVVTGTGDRLQLQAWPPKAAVFSL